MSAAIQAETDGDPSIDAAALEMADADIGALNVTDMDTQHHDTDGETNERSLSSRTDIASQRSHHPLRTSIEDDEEGQLLPKDSANSMDIDNVA
jgi:hypothetical protein